MKFIVKPVLAASKAHKAYGYSYNTSDRVKVADLDSLLPYIEIAYDYYNVEGETLLDVRKSSLKAHAGDFLNCTEKVEDDDDNPWGYYIKVSYHPSSVNRSQRIYVSAHASDPDKLVKEIIKELENKHGDCNIIIKKKGIPYLAQ